MDDVIANMVSPEHLREWSISSNVIAAFFIGPYLAFASTPGAGFCCPQAAVRFVHRVLLVLFSITLLNNAMILVQTGRTPTGAGFALNVIILFVSAWSAVRYHFWMADIPKGSSWSHPHFAQRSRR